MLKNKMLFISHASKDKDLVDKFVDLLDTGCGLNRDEIFCTSLESLGVPPGEDFIQFIKEKIRNPSFIILMLSPNYYDSVFCLCELGASWALSSSVFPIVVPPFNKEDIKATLAVTQLGTITEPSYLDMLRDQIKSIHNTTGTTPTWNVKRDQFLSEIDDVLKTLPVPKKVTLKLYDEALSNYRQCLKQLNVADKETIRLKQIIEKLKKLKDAEQVKELDIKLSGKWEYFRKLVDTTNEALSKLPSVVIEAIYFHLKNENLVIDRWKEKDKDDDAIKAVDDEFLWYREEEGYLLKEEDPTVRKALEVLDELDTFLNRSDIPKFKREFEDKYKFRPSLSNRRFWVKFLEGIK